MRQGRAEPPGEAAVVADLAKLAEVEVAEAVEAAASAAVPGATAPDHES